MSSLKMTFSLTSLIFLIALGLVFVPTSVMAHPNVAGETPADTHAITGHMHPEIMFSVGDDIAATDAAHVVVDTEEHSDPVTVDEARTLEFDLILTHPDDVGTLPGGGDFTNAAAFINFTAATGQTSLQRAEAIWITVHDGTDLVGTTTLTSGESVARAAAATKPMEWTIPIAIALPAQTADTDITGDTDLAATQRFVKAAVKKGIYVDIRVNAGSITSNDVTAPYVNQKNLAVNYSKAFRVYDVAPDPEDPDPVEFMVEGTPSLTTFFSVIFTSTTMNEAGDALVGAEIKEEDVEVTGGFLIPGSLKASPASTNVPENTIWTGSVHPYSGVKAITVTIKDDSKTAAQAAEMKGFITTQEKVGTLNSIDAPAASDDKKFVVTLMFAEGLPATDNVAAEDIKVNMGAMVGNIANNLARDEWEVEITPKAATATTIDLSAAGLIKFDTGADYAAVTVASMSTPTAGTVIESVDFTSYDKTTGMVVLTETTPLGVNGFGVVQTHNPMLPNIWRFFAETGTINVLVKDKADGTAGGTASDLVISEIMWGLDLRLSGDAAAANQFIELYNTTADPIDLSMVSLYFDTRDVITPADDAAVSGYTILDQVSNAKGVGWDIANASGQSGRVARPDDVTTFVAQNLISMYLDINYATVEDATKNREAQLGGVPDGSDLSKWKPSDEVAERYDTNLVGSPGEKHFSPTGPLTATVVPYSPFVINEIGNYTGDKYDWVEIRNVTTTKQNLKNYKLSQVKADKTDTALVTIEDKDQFVEGGEVALIVNSDPHQDADHPVAAGIHMNSNSTRVETTGVKSRYYVDSGLKLADSGKTLLILRSNNSNDHLGKPAHIVDLVGTAQITDSSPTLRTDLWPLVGGGKPGGNVVTGVDEDFRAGRIYHRNKANAGIADETITLAGDKGGLGYKRGHAGQMGSPGYPDSSLVDNETALTTAGGEISISEIMYAKRRNEPQWIELYNSSKTHAVNLNDWKLKIEHAPGDETIDIRSRSVTTNVFGGNIVIQPNQTVLIASTTTSASSAQPRGRSDFAERIIDLWTQKDKLEVPASGKTRRTYRLLSEETGFRLTLLDKSGSPVDTAGNLDTDGTVMWELPTNGAAEGRSSIIRRYNQGKATEGGGGVPMPGTAPAWSGMGSIKDQDLKSGEGMAGWIYAAASELASIRYNETFYGAADDISTPGYRVGGPLPVSLSKFRPERMKETGEIVVRWITESELNNAGFNILRSEKRDSEFTKVHFEAGEGTTSERTVYEWKDTTAKPNVVYYYQIQDVSLDGEVTTLRTTHLRGNVTAVGKATTTWGEIKALQ